MSCTANAIKLFISEQHDQQPTFNVNSSIQTPDERTQNTAEMLPSKHLAWCGSQREGVKERERELSVCWHSRWFMPSSLRLPSANSAARSYCDCLGLGELGGRDGGVGRCGGIVEVQAGGRLGCSARLKLCETWLKEGRVEASRLSATIEINTTDTLTEQSDYSCENTIKKLRVCLSVCPAVPGVRRHDCIHATFTVRAAVGVAAARINAESW